LIHAFLGQRLPERSMPWNEQHLTGIVTASTTRSSLESALVCPGNNTMLPGEAIYDHVTECDHQNRESGIWQVYTQSGGFEQTKLIPNGCHRSRGKAGNRRLRTRSEISLTKRGLTTNDICELTRNSMMRSRSSCMRC
jgi:hypothetical protein